MKVHVPSKGHPQKSLLRGPRTPKLKKKKNYLKYSISWNSPLSIGYRCRDPYEALSTKPLKVVAIIFILKLKLYKVGLF